MEREEIIRRLREIVSQMTPEQIDRALAEVELLCKSE